ncbi:L28 family ribosomal protein [Candidatus Vidania fulgoroideorum]
MMGVPIIWVLITCILMFANLKPFFGNRVSKSNIRSSRKYFKNIHSYRFQIAGQLVTLRLRARDFKLICK